MIKELMSSEDVEQALAEYKAEIKLPAELVDEHKQLVSEREGFKSYWDEAKTRNPNVLQVDLDEFNRRNDALEAKDAAFRGKVAPFIKAVKNERILGLQRALGKAQPGFSFGSAAGGEGKAFRSLSEALTASEEFKSFQKGATSNSVAKFDLSDLDVKALFSTTAGFTPPADRGPSVVEKPRRRAVIADYIPTIPTVDKFIVWMLQTVFTNNAAAVAEGAVKPESAVQWDEVKDQLEKVAHWIPVTTEVLRYNPRVAALLDGEMLTMLRLKAEELMISGTGVSPQLKGFLTRPGLAVYAKQAGENNADALYMSMAQVRNDAYAEPGVVFLHPDNFTPIALMKNTQGDYIYGNPAQGGPQTVWGKPVEQTKAMPVGNALTGDFDMYSELYVSGDASVEVGYVNDDFVRNRRVMLAEIFLALVIKRASAFSNTQDLDPQP